MPEKINQLDSNHDSTIDITELKTALDNGFFDKEDNKQALVDQFAKEKFSELEKSLMKSMIAELFKPENKDVRDRFQVTYPFFCEGIVSYALAQEIALQDELMAQQTSFAPPSSIESATSFDILSLENDLLAGGESLLDLKRDPKGNTFVSRKLSFKTNESKRTRLDRELKARQDYEKIKHLSLRQLDP